MDQGSREPLVTASARGPDRPEKTGPIREQIHLDGGMALAQIRNIVLANRLAQEDDE
jgi:hypothetical protein